MNYAKAFRILRAAFGLRQTELAHRINISPSQLSLIEAGKRQPSLKTIDALARALGIPQALITVLATAADDLESQPDQDVSELGKILLRLLVSASQEQRSLPLSAAK